MKASDVKPNFDKLEPVPFANQVSIPKSPETQPTFDIFEAFKNISDKLDEINKKLSSLDSKIDQINSK